MDERPAMPLREQLRRLAGFVRPYRWFLVLAFLATAGSAVLGLAFPWILGRLVDAAVLSDGSTDTLNRSAALLLGVFGAQALLNHVRIRTLAHVGQHVVADLRAALFERIVSLPVSYFDDRPSGTITSRLLSDAGMVYSSASGTAPQAVYAAITVLGGMVLAVAINPFLALVLAVLLPLGAWMGRHYGHRIRAVSRDYQQGLASTNALATEAISSVRVIKWFNAEETVSSQYGDRLDSVVSQGLDRARVRSRWSPAGTFVTSLAVVAVVWIGGRFVQQGDLTPGDLVSFLLYARIVASGISSLVDQYSRLANAMGASERIFTMLDTPGEAELPGGERRDRAPVVVADRRGHVRFEHVSFSYPTREGRVLEDLILEIRPGETVALIGPSGAGKTTLTQLISRFYDPDSGSVLVDGVDVRDQDLTDLRRSIAVVPQEVMLLSGSVAQNIRLARPEAGQREMKDAGRSANAHDFIRRFPRGYGTRIGERGLALSGGQRQRIAIARALLANPRLLILDEATNALDADSEALVQEALGRLMAERTNIVIAHRLSTVRSADRVVVLSDGRIVEDGPPERLLSAGGEYARMAAIQLADA